VRERHGSSRLLGPDPALAGELLELLGEQRETVHLGAGEDPEDRLAWREVTVRHADRLAEILAEHGWPGAHLVGGEAGRAAWLIALHADQQLDVQRQALALMSDAVDAGEADRTQLAHLRDRVLVNSGRPQLCGTQIAGVRDGVPVPWPIQDPGQLDVRRASAGLESWAEYVASHRAR
jgi:hypothetical protein